MGYAEYDTPAGLAGYSVSDTCHETGCEEAIDRGLAFLCGEQPGVRTEVGCGMWFCGEHLFMPWAEVAPILGGGVCRACRDGYEEEHPGCRERDEAAWQARCDRGTV